MAIKQSYKQYRNIGGKHFIMSTSNRLEFDEVKNNCKKKGLAYRLIDGQLFTEKAEEKKDSWWVKPEDMPMVNGVLVLDENNKTVARVFNPACASVISAARELKEVAEQFKVKLESEGKQNSFIYKQLELALNKSESWC